MGKGIALEFRRRFPEMFIQYQHDCEQGKLVPGKIYYYPWRETLILNFAVKKYWRYPSKPEWIQSCLKEFVNEYPEKKISSVAFPWIGAQNGGIPLKTIQFLMNSILGKLQDIDIEVYDFDPDASDPLYEKLNTIVNSFNSLTVLKRSGLKVQSCQKIIKAIEKGEVKSLPGIVSSKIIGDKSIDKLYLFLRDYDETKSLTDNTFPTQPLLFPENDK